MTILKWNPETNTFPSSTETIHVEFIGLMAFCAGRDKVLNRDRCEVGIINNAPDHELVVKMWKNSRPVSDWRGPAAGLRGKEFFLRSANTAPELKFYQQGGAFNRSNEDDPRDFRWIVDFENEEFFGRPDKQARLRKDPRLTTPRFNLYNGVLYTLCRTRTSFKRETPQNSLSLGPIARRQAAHLHLEPGVTAQIDLPGLSPSERTLYAANHYDVLIRNICDPNNPRCEEGESDFHYYYETYEPPLARQHYDLLPDSNPRTDICVSQPLEPIEDKGTDRAPCAAAGFGGGGGLDYPF